MTKHDFIDQVAARLQRAAAMGVSVKKISELSGVTYTKVYNMRRGVTNAMDSDQAALVDVSIERIKIAL